MWYWLRHDKASLVLWQFRLFHRRDFKDSRWGVVLDGKYENPYTVKMLASLKKKVPVICLVRDPISTLKSCVNQGIGDYVRDLVVDKNRNSPSTSAIDLLNKFIHSPNQQLRFTTGLQQVQHIAAERTMLFDTTDVNSRDNTTKTLQQISKVLQIENVAYEELFDQDVTFNDFVKRSFPKTETIDVTSGCLKVIFGFKESFYRYFDGSRLTLPYPVLFENIPSSSFPNKSFRVLLGKRFVLERTLKKLQEDPNVKTAVSNAIEQYCAKVLEAERRYKETMLDERDVLKLLKENPESSKKLRELLKYEVSEIERLAPHIVEKWQYYKMFLEDES